MNDSLDNIDCCRDEYREIFNRLHATLEELDPQTEYNGFMERNGYAIRLLVHIPASCLSCHRSAYTWTLRSCFQGVSH